MAWRCAHFGDDGHCPHLLQVVLIQQERWVHDVSYARSVATIDVVQHVFL
jgi:hypothetical protein